MHILSHNAFPGRLQVIISNGTVISEFPALREVFSGEGLVWPPAVESSIAVEDAVENRGHYRVFVSRLF